MTARRVWRPAACRAPHFEQKELAEPCGNPQLGQKLAM
jgi:hypothetical protein